MDYSLLIGLHFRDDCSVDEMKSSPRNSYSGIYLYSFCCFLVPNPGGV